MRAKIYDNSRVGQSEVPGGGDFFACPIGGYYAVMLAAGLYYAVICPVHPQYYS